MRDALRPGRPAQADHTTHQTMNRGWHALRPKVKTMPYPTRRRRRFVEMRTPGPVGVSAGTTDTHVTGLSCHRRRHGRSAGRYAPMLLPARYARAHWHPAAAHPRTGDGRLMPDRTIGQRQQTRHLRTKFSRSPLGGDQEYVTCVVRPGVCPARSISSRVRQAARGPSTITSTRPSARLVAEPTSPSRRPLDRTYARKPTPCTVPDTHAVSRARGSSGAQAEPLTPADGSRPP